jgi:hypothetical protein
MKIRLVRMDLFHATDGRRHTHRRKLMSLVAFVFFESAWEWILKKWNGREWTEFIWLRTAQEVVSCVRGFETRGISWLAGEQFALSGRTLLRGVGVSVSVAVERRSRCWRITERGRKMRPAARYRTGTWLVSLEFWQPTTGTDCLSAVIEPGTWRMWSRNFLQVNIKINILRCPVTKTSEFLQVVITCH